MSLVILYIQKVNKTKTKQKPLMLQTCQLKLPTSQTCAPKYDFIQKIKVCLLFDSAYAKVLASTI